MRCVCFVEISLLTRGDVRCKLAEIFLYVLLMRQDVQALHLVYTMFKIDVKFPKISSDGLDVPHTKGKRRFLAVLKMTCSFTVCYFSYNKQFYHLAQHLHPHEPLEQKHGA